MKKLILLPLIIFTVQSYSQEYHQAVGLRGGVTSGITYKKFLDEMKAMEAIFSFRKGGIQITTVRQFHELSFYKYTDKLYFVHGYGGHLGFNYTESDRFLFWSYNEDRKVITPLAGLDGYFALEYRASQSPLVFGIDYKPYFEFSTRLIFDMILYDFSFFIKYTF